jgi:hypothetical protein
MASSACYNVQCHIFSRTEQTLNANLHTPKPNIFLWRHCQRKHAEVGGTNQKFFARFARDTILSPILKTVAPPVLFFRRVNLRQMKMRQKQEHKELVDLDMKARLRLNELLAKFEREKQVGKAVV